MPGRPAGWLMRGFIGLTLMGAAPSPGQPPQETLRAVEGERRAGLAAERKAKQDEAAARAKLATLAAARTEATMRLQQAEATEAIAADHMAALAAQHREAEQQLRQQEDNIGPLLPVIERLALYPDATLLALPGNPAAAAQGLAVLHGITRQMAREAEALRVRQTELERLSRAMRAEAPILAAAEKSAAARAASLDDQMASTRKTLTEAQADEERAARTAAAAAARETSLRAAIAAIEAARAREARAAARRLARAARAHKPHEEAEARAAARAVAPGPGLAGRPRHAPVAGRVVRAFGAATEAGPAQGISYAPPPEARVVSPCTGAVLFAGPFRSYGRVMIIDCGHGYVFVLAGLARLEAAVGTSVDSGAPIGAMPGWDPAKGGPRPALYVELRHDGAVVNPAPFLSASQ